MCINITESVILNAGGCGREKKMNYHRLVIAFHVCEFVKFGYFDFIGGARFQRSHVGFGCEIHIVTYGKRIAFYKIKATFYRYFKRKEDVILYYFEHNTKEFIFGRRFYTVAFVSRI